MPKIACKTLLLMLLCIAVLPATPSSAALTPFPAPYQAYSGLEVSKPAADKLRSIAQRFWWNQSPKCSEIRLFMTSDSVTAQLSQKTNAGGFAMLPCAVAFNARQFVLGWDYQALIYACNLYVHEYGHLLGIGHVPGWRSVMIEANFTQNAVVPGCMRAFLPPDKFTEWVDNYGAPVFLKPYR